jgi:hypothetical protein
VKWHWKKYATAAALAAAIGVGVNQAVDSKIAHSDFVGRQKFWTLNRKSMDVYKGEPSNEIQIGDAKYRLWESLKSFTFSRHDIRNQGKTRGKIKQHFELFGKEYSMAIDGAQYSMTRPAKFWRSKWTLSRGNEPLALFNETHRSAYNPFIHEYEIVHPKTGERIGRMTAVWNWRRFLTMRRDYAIEYEKGFDNYLSEPEVTAVLTMLGRISSK